MNYYKTIPEEQETVINIDYFEKILYAYSSRKSVIQRLYARLGIPNKEYYVKGALSGARWEIPFENKKRVNTALSRPLLIGQMK